MKPNMRSNKPPIQPIMTKHILPFYSFSIDFITRLPLSNGFNTILVMMDQGATKTMVLAPCTKLTDILETVKLLQENVFKHFGLPKQIIFDRGPQFASKVFQTLCKKLGIKSKLSTIFHSQTDGQTE